MSNTSMQATEKLGVGPLSPLGYDAVRNMVICLPCKRGVSAERNALDNHLNTYHPRQFGIESRQTIRQQLLDRGYLVKGDVDGEQRAKHCGYHESLPCVEGFHCPLDNCAAAQTEKWVAETIRTRHVGQLVKPQPCLVSWLWGEPKGIFRVEKPAASNLGPIKEGDMALNQAIAKLQDCLRERQANRKVIHTSPTSRESLWYERTGWPMTFDGLDMSQLQILLSLSPTSDDCLDVTVVRESVKDLLRQCNDRLEETYRHAGDGVLLRRILFAVEENNTRRAVERLRTSLTTYTLIWEKFILFLARAAHWSPQKRTQYRLNIDESMIKSLTRLAKQSRQPKSKETITEQPEKTCLSTLSQEILRVSYLMIEQVRGWGQDTHPLLYFLGVQGFNLETARWEKPSRHSSTLSQTIYCIRILTLEHVIQITKSAELVTSQLRDYCVEHLYSSRPKVFDEIFSQRNYALEIARDFYGRPLIHWEPDRNTLLFEGNRIALTEIRHWVNALLNETEETLCTDLLGTERSYLSTFDPARLTDCLTWEAYGASLVDLNRDTLANRLDSVILRSQQNTALPWFKIWERHITVRDAIYTQYMDAIRKWQRKVSSLIFIAGGGCPRATEVGSSLWCNTQASMRSYYIALGQFLWVADYSKIEKVKGAPHVIARFYPRRIGQMMIAFLAEVRPFWQFLTMLTTTRDQSAFSDLVWHTNGEPWTAEQFTPAIEQTTQEYLKVKLGTRAWRQVHIALQHEIVRSEERTNYDDDDSLALQSGHTKETEDQHYALNVEMLRGLDERTMTTFFKSSQKWHSYIGLSETIPTQTLGKRRRESSIGLSTSPKVTEIVSRLEDTLNQMHKMFATSTNFEDKSNDSFKDNRVSIVGSQSDTWGFIRERLHSWYPAFRWRSIGQLEAVEQLVYGDRNQSIVVQLPTGAGKTIVIDIAACLENGKTVLVVVPYRGIRDALVTELTRKGIEVDDFRSEDWRMTDVVVIVLETWTTDNSFQRFVDELVSLNRLSRIIYDEAHLAVMEAENDFRLWAQVLKSRPKNIQHVFMSATLPTEIMTKLLNMVDLEPRQVAIVRQSSNIPGIRWAVREYESQQLMSTLREVLKSSKKAIVYVMSKKEGREIECQTKWPFYSGETSDDEAQKILKAFVEEETSTLVATTALGPGMNLLVDHIVCLGGGWDGITVAQQAGRLVRQPGQVGCCTLLVTRDHKAMITAAATNARSLPGKRMLRDTIDTKVCRRACIVSYLDDTPYDSCQPNDELCDLCAERRLKVSSPTMSSLPTLSQIFAQRSDIMEAKIHDELLPEGRRNSADTTHLSEMMEKTPSRIPAWSSTGPILFQSPYYPGFAGSRSSDSSQTLTMTTPPTSSGAIERASIPASQRLLELLEFNRSRGLLCERCWVHGHIGEHGGNYTTCDRWLPEVSTNGRTNDRTPAEVVGNRIDEIRRRWKEEGRRSGRKLRLHANCGLVLNPNPFHPDGTWNFNTQCAVSGAIWAIVEAALQDNDLVHYLRTHWGVKATEWKAQAAAPYGTLTPLGQRLMSGASGQPHTLVLHEVVIGILRHQGLA